MLAVDYNLLLQEMLSRTSGKVGQVIYWGRLYWPRAEILNGTWKFPELTPAG
jgi:hypothetical protein